MIKNKISDYFIEKDIDIIDLAEKTNIPVEKLKAILNQETSISAELYFIICKALGVQLNTFI